MSNINVVFLDINSNYEKTDKIINTKNKIENPIKILDTFINNIILIDLDINKEDPAKIKYNFSYFIKENKRVYFNFTVVNDLSYFPIDLLNTISYIIFFNLEEEETFNKIEKLLNYMEGSCNFNSKSYFIGVYKNNVLISMDKIKKLIGQKNILFECYSIYVGTDTNLILEDDKSLIKVMTDVFYDIYLKNNKNIEIRKTLENKAKDLDNAKSRCLIY